MQADDRNGVRDPTKLPEYSRCRPSSLLRPLFERRFAAVTAKSARIIPRPDVSRDDYWSLARHPLNSLVFLAPLLAVYELGLLWMGGPRAEALRNGADYWMRTWLARIGLHQEPLLPVLLVGGLLLWHVLGRYPRRVSVDTLAGMGAESLLFAFLLVVLGQVEDLVARRLGTLELLSLGGRGATARLISFVGAGIYEEVLFRLCLLPACYGLFRTLRMPRRWALGLAAFVSSLLFAVAHYVGPAADDFTLFAFTFRLLAGLYFAGLFCLRGIGVTVGTHAAYDVLVGLLLAAHP